MGDELSFFRSKLYYPSFLDELSNDGICLFSFRAFDVSAEVWG
jgi:hypothetical protein